jgi:phosphate transport system substrate-binding protein
MGKSGESRTDFVPSEDDNVLVLGIAGDKNALGFFGFAYYIENTDILKAIPIKSSDSAVLPTFDSIADGTYSPLSRPVFIYVSLESLKMPHVRAFVEYYLTEGAMLIPEVGYVKLGDSIYEEQLKKLKPAP